MGISFSDGDIIYGQDLPLLVACFLLLLLPFPLRGGLRRSCPGCRRPWQEVHGRPEALLGSETGRRAVSLLHRAPFRAPPYLGAAELGADRRLPKSPHGPVDRHVGEATAEMAPKAKHFSAKTAGCGRSLGSGCAGAPTPRKRGELR